jgi:hypothetical protein
MNADQKVTQPSTSTPAPTPPDLRDFPQLDHPYTDIGGKCHFCVCPEAEHFDPYDVQSLVIHVANKEPLVLLLTRRQRVLPGQFLWLILDEGNGSIICTEYTEADALIKGSYYAKGYQREG